MATEQEPKRRRAGVAVTGALLGGVLIAGPLAGQAWCANNLEPQAKAAAGQAADAVQVRGREARIDAAGRTAAQVEAAKQSVSGVAGIRWVRVDGEPAGAEPSTRATSTQTAVPSATASGTASTTASASPSASRDAGLRLTAQGSGSELSGTVNAHTAVESILAQAGRVFGGPVADSVTVDPSATTPEWYTDLGSAMATFPTISGGHMEIAGDSLTVAGTVPSLDALSTLRSAVAGLPAEMDLSGATVEPAITIQASDAGASLTGAIASQSEADALAAQVERVFGGPVTNQVKVDPAVATAPWVSKLTAALESSPAISEGALKATGSGLSVSGTVADAQALATLTSALKGVPLTVNNTVSAAAEQTVPEDVKNQINSTVVDFADSVYSLDGTATAKLDAIIPFLTQYPQLKVAINGYVSLPHTGDEQADSARRAQAVADYLTAAGVDAGRLSVQGRGSADPIASNDTAAGRLANQRASLTVEGN